MTSLVALLHLCDSLFPIGSFAHSDGLEGATSRGEVTDAAGLRKWMDVVLGDTLRHADGPALCVAWTCFGEGRFNDLGGVDDELHALRASSSGRDASRSMGSRLLRTWQQIHHHDGIESLLDERVQFTLPVAFGAVAAAARIPRQSAIEGYMYTRLSAVISAAMRLIPLGQQEAHTLLAEVLARVPAAAGDVLSSPAPPQAFTPLMDVAAMSQQYGHSRLFRS